MYHTCLDCLMTQRPNVRGTRRWKMNQDASLTTRHFGAAQIG
jgi:hypothetical protein